MRVIRSVMELFESVPLATLTTLKVGGTASYVALCRKNDDIEAALAFARERGLPWYVLGGGSNVLAPDEGFHGVIVRALFEGMVFRNVDERVEVEVGSGIVWDELVQESVERKLWGLENLAGIPGLVGAAPVQNIGAYGADVSNTIIHVDVFDTSSKKVIRFSKEQCAFSYRDSFFKHNPAFIIISVCFSLSVKDAPHIEYPDILARKGQGSTLTTSKEIAEVIREIRSKKFPDLVLVGTAGSFFKNPIISEETYAALRAAYPELPGFPQAENKTKVKVPLAWILDHILHLRGYTKGLVRLFEKQPLVLVAEHNATATEINSFADEIAAKVKEATGIQIEREVQSL